jgi:predicted AlkP superfamily pyrophosphatase or phosphodiesterase
MMARMSRLGTCVGLVLVSVTAGCTADTANVDEGAAGAPPRLVLQITVDQLRGDLPTRYFDRLGEGGLRYLWEHGTVYADAHHSHANTETIVGHATLATGAYPAAHGMIGNTWLDRETGEVTYGIEDSRYRLLTAGADVDQQAEIDPTQRAARSEGRSPAAIMVSTFSDELASHTAGRAKVFAVSVKDRGAVSMAGHAGKAFWFSKALGEFVTSSYYYDRYPAWVERWNEQRLPFAHAGQSWTLLHDASTYLFGDADDAAWEIDLAGFGRTFPHPFGEADGRYFTTLLTVSPAADRFTAEFAKTLLTNEALGQDDVPDFLGVSFSSTDYVGHMFGPSSLEAEDNLLQLDRTLADLLAFVDEQVGLDRTLIVLSADHGGPDAPGYLNALGIPAGYIEPATWNTKEPIEAIRQRFNLGTELIENYSHPYIYLSPEVRRLDSIAEIEQAVAEAVERMPGVAVAVSSHALALGDVPDMPLYRSVLENFSPTRSGDVFVVFEPNWFINDFDGLTVAATHGSPWRYDTFVPIVFAGAGIRAQRVYRRVRTVDVAPTLAALLGTKPPSGSVGRILQEVVR